MRMTDVFILDGCVQVLKDEVYGRVSDSRRTLNPWALGRLARIHDDKYTPRAVP